MRWSKFCQVVGLLILTIIGHIAVDFIGARVGSTSKSAQMSLIVNRTDTREYISSQPLVDKNLESRVERLQDALIDFRSQFARLPNSTLPESSGRWCDIYTEEGYLPRVVIPNVWSRAEVLKSHNQNDVTLVVQNSADPKRLKMFVNVMRAWPGPVSLTLYMPHGLYQDKLVEILQQYPEILYKPDLDIHLAADYAKLYPQNPLRNIAIQNARTQFVFHLDADFVPSCGLYHHLLNLTEHGWPSKTLLVIPALEYLFEMTEYRPLNKEAVLKLWQENKVQSFQELEWPQEHGFTNFTKWRNTNQSYELVGHHERFEPYLMFRRSDVPKFDERFTGGLNDKISLILKLFAFGFKFIVDGRHFGIHIQHTRKRVQLEYIRCNFVIYVDLIRGLAKDYPGQMKHLIYDTAPY